MNPLVIAVCTTTSYPRWYEGEADVRRLLDAGDRTLAESKVRGDLALETASAVLRTGHRLILVDGGSGSAFQAELARRRIPFRQEASSGMTASRLQAIAAAYEEPAVRAVVWIEPEKVGMADEAALCAAPVIAGEAALVVPGRTEPGWGSLPTFQRESEREGNREFNERLTRAGLLSAGQDLDVYFGPRVFSATRGLRDRMLAVFGHADAFGGRAGAAGDDLAHASISFAATFFPVVAALHGGLTVKAVPTMYAYPRPQRAVEEHGPFADGTGGYREKRRSQAAGVLSELARCLRFLGHQV